MSNILLKLYDKQEMLINENTEIRDYYDIISCGSFYADNRIVFVLKFPIMYKNTYTYYHLFPTPTYNSTILIPPKPYLAVSGDKHQYMETECKRFHEVYYCEEAFFTMTSRSDDCIYLLILKQEIAASCQYTAFKTNFELFQKFDDYHYAITCPERTKSNLLCDEEEIRFIEGTYLIEIPEGCSFITASTSVRNYKNQIKGRPLKLLSFQLSNVTILNSAHPLKLEKVPLDQLYNLEALLEKENTLHIPNLSDENNRHLIWTGPIYIVIAIIIGVILWRKSKLYWSTRRNEAPSNPAVELTPAGPPPFFTGRSSQ
jgi:hypothetical protein